MNKIEDLFTVVSKTIDDILKDDLYKDVESLVGVKEIIDSWYKDYKNQNTLKTIDPEDLKNIDAEITTVFASYISVEPIDRNYVEVLLHSFDQLEKEWKKEMLGDNKDVR